MYKTALVGVAWLLHCTKSACHSALAAVLWDSDMTIKRQRVMFSICETVCEKERHCKVCLYRATPLPVGAAASCADDTALCCYCLLRLADTKGHDGAHELPQHSLLVRIISFQLLLQCEYLLIPLIESPCQGNHDVPLLQQQLLIPVHLHTNSDVSHGSCMRSVAAEPSHHVCHDVKVATLCQAGYANRLFTVMR